MKFKPGDTLKFYDLTPVGWIEFNHYCIISNSEYLKEEENIRKDLTEEMYEIRMTVIKTGLFKLQVEQEDEWGHTHRSWYSKKNISKLIKESGNRETFYRWLREEMNRERKKKHP